MIHIWTFIWLTQLTARSQGSPIHSIDTRRNIHCTNGTCYPLVFEATNDWKPIKQGQQIPAGLHVRINMESGDTEGRLLQEQDGESRQQGLVEVKAEEQKRLETEIVELDTVSNIQSFDLLNEETQVRQGLLILGSPVSVELMDHVLDSLVELSHEREYGVIIVTQGLDNLLRLLSDDRPSVREKTCRILGASFSNNNQAFQKVLEPGVIHVLKELIESLKKEKSDMVIPRMIYAIHALANCPEQLATGHAIRQMLLSKDQAATIRGVFINGPLVAQVKCARLARDVWDMNLKSDLERTQRDASIKEKADNEHLHHEADLWSRALQDGLISHGQSHEYKYESLRALVHFKRAYPGLSMDSEFTEWLAREYDRATGQSRSYTQDNEGDPKENFLSLIKEVRHNVFGNSKARKHFGDEL